MPAGPEQHVYSSAPYDSPYTSHDKSLNNNNPAVNGGDESATSIFQSVKEQVLSLETPHEAYYFEINFCLVAKNYQSIFFLQNWIN